MNELIGPKICLMGLGGVGKSYSIGTLVDWAAKNSFEVAVLFTENSTETLLGYWRDPPKDSGRQPSEPPACLYWHQQLTQAVGLKAITDMADKVGLMSYEGLTKTIDPARGQNNPFAKILASCSKFTDDRTGKDLGPVDSWPVTRIFVIDSLTELGNAAMKMQVGARPTGAPGDYGVAQGMLMNFLRLCTQAIPCPFVLISHVDRELNPVTQAPETSIKAIGKALASEIPTLFGEVIYATRDGTKFNWDTSAFGVSTKTRYLGYRAGIVPDFAQIMDLWIKRRGA